MRWTQRTADSGQPDFTMHGAGGGDEAVLALENLRVRFSTDDGEVIAVHEVSCEVAAGECLGVVGESGSGKSQLFLAALGLLAANGRASGSVRLRGRELLGLDPRALKRIRGKELSMVFQDPMTALTPHLTIGRQLAETLTEHGQFDRREIQSRILDALSEVNIPAAPQRLQQYPHELSGGLRQRVMIAMALLCRPAVLIADEPTTALDVTIQAEILDLLRQLKQRQAISIVLITHDLGVVANLCDRVLVMYAGRIVERGATTEILHQPQHPYTRALLASIPHLEGDATRRLDVIPGQLPDSRNPPAGCAFAPRCAHALARCASVAPALRLLEGRHYTACHLGEADTP